MVETTRETRGECPPRDNGRADGNDRAYKDWKGKKPAHHHMPWDDDSPSDDSSFSSSSLDPSLDNDYLSSDEYWANTHASQDNCLDKKALHKYKCKTIKKIRAKTEDDECCHSWLKGILKEYKKQIHCYCNGDPVQNIIMPKGIKIQNPRNYLGSNDVEDFDTWLQALL